MGRFILKITDDKRDWYLVWSTIVDAPVTYGMDRKELADYWKEEYGRQGMYGFDADMEEVDEKMCNSRFETPDMLFGYNQAGDGGACLDRTGILEKYCYNKPIINQPDPAEVG